VAASAFDVRRIVTGSPPPRDASYAAVTTPAGYAVACARCGATLAPAATSCPRCGGPVTTINPVEQGERIRLRLQESIGDSYRLVELLGRGGMGIVFRAHEMALDREVALKVLALDPILSPEAYARFEREAKLAARLDHPNVVPIFAVGQRNTVAFYTMRLVRGGTLEDMIADHKALGSAHAIEILRDVAHALDYAHGQGVVHRDIKPGNVLIGDSGHAMVSDFGIARGLGVGDSSATSAVIGSPGYMSPEQWRGEEIDARADQYALGVMAFELLTGHRPFETVKVQDLMRLHLSAEVPAASSITAALPPYVDLAIKRAMSKTASARFTSATAFIDALAGKRPVGGTTRTSISAVPVADVRRSGSGAGAKAFAALILVAVTVGAVVMAKSRAIPTFAPKAVPVPVAPESPPLPDSTLNVDTTFNLDSAAHAENGPVGERQPVAIDPALLLSRGASQDGEPHGYIRVVARGGAAKVRIDGRTFGFSPLVVRVEPGPHIVSLESSGDAFLPSQISITVSERDTMLAVFTARFARGNTSDPTPPSIRPAPVGATDTSAQPDSTGHGSTASSLPAPVPPATEPTRSP
jgi:serine/threonine protein kinase